MTNPKRQWKTLQLVRGLCVVDSRTLQQLVRTRQSTGLHVDVYCITHYRAALEN